MYSAARGGGAWQGERRLSVSEIRDPDFALIGTGFPFRDNSGIEEYQRQFARVAGATSGIRRPGSAALDLGDVAAGRFDGFWEQRLSAWDIAAGVLLIREAGGVVTDFAGRNVGAEHTSVVAGIRRSTSGCSESCLKVEFYSHCRSERFREQCPRMPDARDDRPTPQASLSAWLDAVAAAPPSPAGGSAAAIAAALAAALATMVADLTRTKESYAPQHERARHVLERAAPLRTELLALAVRDAEAFENFLVDSGGREDARRCARPPPSNTSCSSAR